MCRHLIVQDSMPLRRRHDDTAITNSMSSSSRGFLFRCLKDVTCSTVLCEIYRLVFENLRRKNTRQLWDYRALTNWMHCKQDHQLIQDKGSGSIMQLRECNSMTCRTAQWQIWSCPADPFHKITTQYCSLKRHPHPLFIINWPSGMFVSESLFVSLGGMQNSFPYILLQAPEHVAKLKMVSTVLKSTPLNQLQRNEGSISV